MGRLRDQVIVMMLVLVALLGLTSCGVLAAETQQAPIKIDRVDVQVDDLGPDGQASVSVHVVGYYGVCSRSVHEPVVSRQGSTIAVTIVVEYIVHKDSSCPAMIEPYDRTIDLGPFGTGRYTLRVNDYSTTFTIAGGPEGDQVVGIIRVDPLVGRLGLDGQAPVSVHVEGALPCMNEVARAPEMSRNGNTVTVRILYDGPPGGICLTAGKSYEQDIDLGSFASGIYTLRVNDYTTTLTVPGGAEGNVMAWPLWPTFTGLFGD